MFNAKRKRIDNETEQLEALSVSGVSRFGDGSAAAPSITFISDSNTGLYHTAAADTIGFSSGGTKRFHITTNEVESTVPIRIPDGTAGTPALAFDTYTTTGLYSSAANTIGMSTGGTLRMSVSSSAATSTVPYVTSSSTDSSSTSTGSIITSGGIGIAKNLIIGGYLRVPTSSLSVTGASTSIGNGDSHVRLTGNTPVGGANVSLPSAASNLGRTINIFRSGAAGTYGVSITVDSASDVFDEVLQSSALAFTPSASFNFSFTSLGLDPITSKYVWGITGSSKYTISRNATGPIASTAASIVCYRKDKLVSIYVPGITANGNNTAAVITFQALPRDYWPASGQQYLVRVEDATTFKTGLLNISTSGVIDIYTSVSGATFSASTSQHSTRGLSFTYESTYPIDV